MESPNAVPIRRPEKAEKTYGAGTDFFKKLVITPAMVIFFNSIGFGFLCQHGFAGPPRLARHEPLPRGMGARSSLFPALARYRLSRYDYFMFIEQTVEIPADYRIFKEKPAKY